MALTDAQLERVLARSADLFAREGYDRVTLTKIACLADIPRRALLGAFPDKGAIFAGAARWLAEERLGEIGRALAGVDTLEEKLLLICFDWGLHGREMAMAYPHGADFFDLSIAAARQACQGFETLVSVLISGHASASAIDASAPELARALMHGLRGARDGAASLEEAVRLIAVQVAVLARAIGIDERPRGEASTCAERADGIPRRTASAPGRASDVAHRMPASPGLADAAETRSP